MDKVVARWNNTGLSARLQKIKKVYIGITLVKCPLNHLEPRANDQTFQHQLDMYNLAAQTNSGAILLAVCRGKISEGLDFGDANARAVFVVGIPFPNFKDLKVSLKMEYNNQKRKANDSFLTGDQWYTLQAFRAVNQGMTLDFFRLLTCLKPSVVV